MGSIPKIVSTPIKWASKQILNHTLLRFPGGDSHSPIACTYCPEMCRFSCPTAVASGNDAVTPCNKMSLLYKEKEWPGQTTSGPLWPIYDCTGCGRCTEYCIYGMPVMEHLFEARKKFPWERSQKAAALLRDQDDIAGDLAHELGDSLNAERRAAKFARKRKRTDEPKSLHFLTSLGFDIHLTWEKFLRKKISSKALEQLSGKRWLLHESVWWSRNLKRFEDQNVWLEQAARQGVQMVLPYSCGMDAIDCGGEGAYHLLFPDQASQMAREIWERDSERADGILCMSQRCAAHLKAETQVTVLSFSELFLS